MSAVRYIGLALLAVGVHFLSASVVEAQYWESPKEPGGAKMEAVYAGENGQILASTVFYGPFRSTDNGATWTKATMTSGGHRILIFLRDDDGTIYGGVDEGVVRSQDDGKSWTYLESPLIQGMVYSLALGADGDLFAGCLGDQAAIPPIDGGVYRSSDRGETWEHISEDLTGFDSDIGGVAVKSDGTIFAAIWYRGVFRSLDSGITWTKCDSGLTSTAVRTVATNGLGDVFVGTISGGVYRSGDNGASWQQLAESPSSADVIAIMNDGTIVVGGTGDGLWFSVDNGDSWNRMSYDITSPSEPTCFSVDATGRVVVGSYNGVHVAESLESPWDRRNHGLLGIPVRDFACRGSEIYAACYLGVLKSTDLGNSWEAINPNSFVKEANAVAVSSNGTLYMGSRDDGPWRSYDGGESWESIDVGFNGFRVFDMYIAPNDYLFVASIDGLQRSTDGGDSWHDVNDVVDTWAVQDFTASDSGMLFVAAGGRVYRSPDSGGQWYPADNGLDSIGVTALCHVDGQYLFAGAADSGVYRSDDNGDTWSRASDELVLYVVESISSNQLGHLLAGTRYGGVFLSTDYGDNWTEVNDGLLDDKVTAFEVMSSGRFLVATESGGVSRSTSFVDCCIGSRGNIDGDLADATNVSDLTYLAAFIFSGGASPVCAEEADVTGDGLLNIQDLTYFVSFLFSGGPAPAVCP